MSLTILTMVNRAQQELGLPQSTSLFTSPDATGTQMLGLANRVLDELRRMHVWTELINENNLVVNAPILVTGNMTPNSALITGISPNTTGLSANNFAVVAPSLPIAARVKSVDSSSQVTLTMENTLASSVTGASITFAQDTYTLPTGWDWYNNRTFWDRTNRWELLGPDSGQLDQWHRSGIVVTGPRRHFRQVGNPYENQFRIWPPPVELVNPLQLVFEYVSLDAVSVAGSATNFAQYFANDTDQILLDENAVIMGIKWMFWEVKGFGSYVTMQNRWIDYVNRLIARDGGSETLNLVKRINPIFISPANVQDGFFPGPVGPNSA